MSSETTLKLNELQNEKKKSNPNFVVVVACATGVVLGGALVSTTTPSSQYTLNSSTSNRHSTKAFDFQTVSKETISNQNDKIFVHKIIDNQINNSQELNAMELLLKKIEKSTKEMAIVGAVFGGFILSLPLYSDVSFVNALAASLIGFSLPAFKLMQNGRGNYGRKE